MRNFKIGLMTIAAAMTLAASSCQKDDTLFYNNLTMGNIVDGRFVSDQGNTFNIVDQACEAKLDTMYRVITLCNILRATEGQENEYDVALLDYAPVLAKDAVKIEDAVSEEINVKDPIYLEQLWYSGGYINMLIKYPVDIQNSTRHLINLVYSIEEDGSYSFELRHNAFGEVRDDTESTMFLAGGYVSFPISRIIEKDSAKLTFRWKWYKSAGYGWTTEIEEKSYGYDWKREGFEQVPQNLKLTFKVPTKAE